MSTQDIKSYVINCLKDGFDKQSVVDVMSKAGWPENEIENVFNDSEVKVVIAEINGSKQHAPEEDTDETVFEEDRNAIVKEEVFSKKEKNKPSSEDSSHWESQISSQDDNNSELLEVNTQLKEYIIDNLNKGFDSSLMRGTVIEAGWPENEVNRVFEDKDVKKLILTLSGEMETASVDGGNTDETKRKSENSGHRKTPKSFVVPFVHRSNSELKNYVINEIKKGGSKLSVKATAIDAGWPEGEVDKVFEDEDVRKKAPVSKEKVYLSSKKDDSKKKDSQEENFLDEFINPAGYKSQRSLTGSDTSDHKETPVNPFFSIFTDKSKASVEEEVVEEREVLSDEASQEEEEEEFAVVQEETPVEEVVRDPYLELRKYVINEMNRGISRLAIKTAAVDAGWSGEETDKILNEKGSKNLSSKQLN